MVGLQSVDTIKLIFREQSRTRHKESCTADLPHGKDSEASGAGGFFFHRGGISAERLATSTLRYTLACMTVATASAQMISTSTFGLRAYIL
jgi:hypothetical protein